MPSRVVPFVPERSDELWRYARRAQAVANRLRAWQKHAGE